MKPMTDKDFGALGEKLAAGYLKKNKYKILEKNYKNPLGEIDIIARDAEYIVFVEVKTRSAEPFLSGMYAVDRRKREHILRVASAYLAKEKRGLQPRFDIIEVEIDRATGRLAGMNHIPNAFMQEGPYARF